MTDHRNFIVFILLSLVIILGYDLIFAAPKRAQLAEEQARQAEQQLGSTPAPDRVAAEINPETILATTQRTAVDSPRIPIETDTYRGSVALRGGRIDDLFLTRYQTSIDEDAEDIHLLKRLGEADHYYANVSWWGAGNVGSLPSNDTLWTADGTVLAPDTPLTLRWTNETGLNFERRIEVDEDSLFTITQTVTNTGAEQVEVAPYAYVRRRTRPETSGIFILHEGAVGVLDGLLVKHSYSKLEEDSEIRKPSTGGWLGITDKYWLVALIPDQGETVTTKFSHDVQDGAPQYQTDFIQKPAALAPGERYSATTRLFAGPKVVDSLQTYERDLGIDRFDAAVDWGWFWFLTRPFFTALHWINLLVGNFGVAILILTVLVKGAFYPLASKSFQSMARMKKLQPKMKELQERYKDNREQLSKEMMEMYKKEKVNPAAGCLPILIQIPVFFALYKVLFVTIEMRHQPFFGWIQDLSAPDPATLLTLFGWVQWDVPGILQLINIGIWPLLMGITTFLQFKLNPQQMDPIQQKIFLFMPIFMTFVVAQFPAGLVIYWTWNTVLTAAQQWLIYRNADDAPPRKRKPA